MPSYTTLSKRPLSSRARPSKDTGVPASLNAAAEKTRAPRRARATSAGSWRQETKPKAPPDRARQTTARYRRQAAELRQRLAAADAELKASQTREEWLQSALASHRHARQILEASISAGYAGTVERTRRAIQSATPKDAVVLVVSKGDEALVQVADRQAWHFPRAQTGVYAGHYPSSAPAVLEHLRALIGQGAQFLAFPKTAFWWFEHYQGLREYLEQCHHCVCESDDCVLFKLGSVNPSRRGTLERETTSPADFAALSHPCSNNLCDVVCFPIIDWTYRFQRPQQLMRQFATAGHRVFYLSHEIRTTGNACILRPLAANIHEVSLRGAQFKIRDGLLDTETREALIQTLSALSDRCLSRNTLAMVQSPFWWPITKAVTTTFGWPVVYDCMDLHAGFCTGHPLLIEQEKELLTHADLVVASSAHLEAEARKRNHNVVLLRNACDFDHFAKVAPKPVSARPVIGYYGAIAEWFDSELVADLAERRPDWDFILVGSTLGAELGRLPNLTNVSFPGECPYNELPDWLARFDVTILPFKRTPLTEATNPVKAYEILASGRPLVSVPLPECVLMAPHVRLASTGVEFERAVAEELKSGGDRESERRGFARLNSWPRRFASLAPMLQTLVPALPNGHGTQPAPRRTPYVVRSHGTD